MLCIRKLRLGKIMHLAQDPAKIQIQADVAMEYVHSLLYSTSHHICKKEATSCQGKSTEPGVSEVP